MNDNSSTVLTTETTKFIVIVAVLLFELNVLHNKQNKQLESEKSENN